MLLFERQETAENAGAGATSQQNLAAEGAVLQHLEVAFKHDIQLGQVTRFSRVPKSGDYRGFECSVAYFV